MLKKAEITQQIETELIFNYNYFVLLVLSVVIATLGLILGNNSIIIGAMILSPLMWPIIGVSLATVTSKKHLFINSISLLFISIILAIFVSLFITLTVPFNEINNEILLRGNPTFIDLVIAIAAGIAATLVISWPQFSVHIAGVAVAASILPPICVTGIALGYHISKIAYGSFVLFLTNLSSIIFAGIVVFALLGFFKKDDKDQVKAVGVGLLFSFLFIVLLGIQLLFSLNKIIYENNIKREVKEILAQELSSLSNDIEISSVNISPSTPNSDILDIQADIKVPSDINIDVKRKNMIVDILNQKLSQETNLDLRIIPVLKVLAEKSDKEDKEEKMNKKIETIITQKAEEISPDIIVESINTSFDEKDGGKYIIKALFRIPEGLELYTIDKYDLILLLEKELQNKVDLEIIIIRYLKI